MPRSSSLSREVSSLSTLGGVSGRKKTDEFSKWNFDMKRNGCLVTPAGNNSGCSKVYAEVDDVCTDYDDSSCTSSDDECYGNSFTDDDDSSSTISNIEDSNMDNDVVPMIPWNHGCFYGNRLVNLPCLVNAIQDCTVCKCCANEISDNLFQNFIEYCENEMCQVNLAMRDKSMQYQLRLLRDKFSIRKLYSTWKSRQTAVQQSELRVREITYGLATNIEIQCNRCNVLPNVRPYNRDWKNHVVTVSAKKRQNAIEKSEICQYDVNIKYCTALQMMGIGGEHAAVMAAFLDLPEPQKWPRQFSVLEKYLYLPAETIKLQSQQESSNEEVAATLADDHNVVQQNLLMQDLPIPRVEASFDMGWQVRSSGGKYGSSTGHALLIGARTRKVLDSV
jgi:hypothetical protein